MPYPPFHPDSKAKPPMIMARREFEAAFGAESRYVEMKSSAGGNAIRDTIVALSNTDGGVVVVGVRDDGVILGCELTPSIEDTIHQHVATIRNPGRYEAHSLLVDDRPLTVVSVARRVAGVAQTSDGRVLVRKGSTNVPLFDTELGAFLSERSLVRFESTVTSRSLATADPECLDRLISAFGWDVEEAPVHLRDRGLTALGANADHLTVAGVLVLTARPDEVLPKAFVEVLRFGESSQMYEWREEIRGPVDVQVARSVEFVNQQLGSESVMLGARRYEMPRLPPQVVREAVANAVAHRSYELDRMAVRIEIRPSEVRVTSPGPLPEPVTEKNIRDVAAPRNPDVIAVLRRYGLAEDYGLGVDVMQDQMAAALLDAPAFRDTGSTVVVELPVRSPVSAQERAWVMHLEQTEMIEPEDRILLIHAARGEELTNSRARELMGTEDRQRARTALHRLRDSNLLVQEGERGGASYRLAKHLGAPVGLRLGRDELEALVLDATRAGPITNSDVRQITGLDRAAALALLSRLVDDGRLMRRGERRGTHYVPAREL